MDLCQSSLHLCRRQWVLVVSTRVQERRTRDEWLLSSTQGQLFFPSLRERGWREEFSLMQCASVRRGRRSTLEQGELSFVQ
jgi:hypothetical protein